MGAPFRIRYGLEIENGLLYTQSLVGSVDPSQGAGLAAPIGSVYHRQGTNGEIWIKYAAGDTAWRREATEDYVDSAVANLSSGTRWRAEIVVIGTGDDIVASPSTTVVDDAANTDTTFKVADVSDLKVGMSVVVGVEAAKIIESINSGTSFITLSSALSAEPAASDSVEGTAVSTIEFSDDDNTTVTAPQIGEYVLSGIGNAAGLKLWQINSSSEYELAVDALGSGDVFVINNYLPASPDQGEDTYQVVVTNVAAGTVKAVPFNPRVADEIGLSSVYAAASGDVADTDDVESAIEKLDGNIDAVNTSLGTAQGATSLGTIGGTAGADDILSDTETVKSALIKLGDEIGDAVVPVTRTNNPISDQDVNSNIEKLDAAIGTNTELGTPKGRTTGVMVVNSSVSAKLGKLDTYLGDDVVPTTRTVGALVAANDVGANLEALDRAIGTNAHIGSTEFVSTSNSVNQNLSALDAGIKDRLERDNVTGIAADTPTTVFSFLTKDYRAMEFTLAAHNSTSGKFYATKILVSHNRAGTTIATVIDDTLYATVFSAGTKLLSAVSCALSGTGDAQAVNLSITAAETGTDVSVTAVKLL
ncbi:MAG: hypothetical protein HQM11_07705 [SAR324 cluster bacterium]|nr:hypothetical protein [SAR324 cluster bacterium]